MKRILSMILALVVVMTFSLPMMGCSKAEKTVKTFRTKSAQLAVYGEKITTAIGNAYVAGEISREQLKELNKATGAFTSGLGTYREAVSAAEKIVRSGQPLPRDALGVLDRLFDTEVVAAFTKIAEGVGVLSIGQSEKIKTLLSGARFLILAIKALIADARAEFETAGVSYA